MIRYDMNARCDAHAATLQWIKMCRMLGLVSARPVSTRVLLQDAPRSLAELSREHRDGWGIARWSGSWHVEKSTQCAAVCAHYAQVIDHAPANLLIAHVRQKTVGDTSLANTHPFRRQVAGRELVFAHNGTLRDLGTVMKAISTERTAEIAGDTDSERLFAYIATAIDEAGDLDEGIRNAVVRLHQLHRDNSIGSINFLLSCGARLYAHRLGRSLHILERGGDQDAQRPAAVAFASEQLTDEAWQEIAEGTLIRVERGANAEPVTTKLV